MRVAVIGTLNNAYASTEGRVIPADGKWHRVSFDLTAGSMSSAGSTVTLQQVLSSVVTLRLLSRGSGPGVQGEPIVSTLGVDNIRALRLPGDANFDGRVSGADFSVVRSNLGSATGATWARGDFNFDGRINSKDMRLLRQHFGISTSPAATAAAAVPEPGGAGLMLVATLLLARPRGRSRAVWSSGTRRRPWKS
jgi:hypothetical protein